MEWETCVGGGGDGGGEGRGPLGTASESGLGTRTLQPQRYHGGTTSCSAAVRDRAVMVAFKLHVLPRRPCEEEQLAALGAVYISTWQEGGGSMCSTGTCSG